MSASGLAARTVLVVAAIVALVPASARGADVNVTTGAELATALATAQVSADPDRIFLAPGTYSGGATGFLYNGASAVEVIGAGQGQTTLTATSPAGWALMLNGGGAQNRVASLTAVAPPDGSAQQRSIIIAGSDGGTIEDVTAEVDPSASTNANAIQLNGTTTVSRVTVTGASSRGIEVQSGNATISDSVVVGPGSQGTGVEAGSATTVATVRRTRVSGHFTAYRSSFSADLTVLDSVAQMPSASSAVGLSATDGNNPSAHDSALTAERVTVVGAGGASSRGAYIDIAGAGDVMSIVLRDVIVHNVGIPLSCTESGGGAGTIATDHSNLSLTGVNDACGGGITHAARTEHAPGFVDQAAGDYRLRFDSPLRDIGRPASPPPGTLDLAGLPRPVDGDGDGNALVDIGAFEYQRSAPQASAASSASSAALGEAVTFTGTASDADPLETALLVYSWSFDDGGTASGPSAQHAFTTPGKHTATLTVTDPVGVSAQAAASVSVAVPDKTAPVGSGLRFRPRSFAAERRGPSIAARKRARRGSRVRYRLSEAATVTFTVERRAQGRRKGKRCVTGKRARKLKGKRCIVHRKVRGSFAHAGKAGANSFRFRGRIGSKSLKSGSYRLVGSPRDGAGNRGKAFRGSFRIVRR